MLTKAILTGGVLSVLAGSIVYFGTEGADASENSASDTARIEQTELAGAPDVAVGDAVTEKRDVKTAEVKTSWARTSEVEKAEVIDEVEVNPSVVEAEVDGPPPSSSEPKTKWLDQYLKKTKPEKASEEMPEKDSPEKEMSSATTYKAESDADEGADIEGPSLNSSDAAPDETDTVTSDRAKKMIMRMEKRKKRKKAHDDEKGTHIVANESRIETLDIEGLDLEALDADGNVDVKAILEELGLDSEKNVEVRVVKRMNGKPSRPVLMTDGGSKIDYDVILTEAKKLLVTDMRNQAFLEIVDHAIDQGDVMQAAAIVGELSTPELRDTARARIGVGQARRGDTEAAFAVLNELEIDELSAPIRLEIITALMATRQEREALGSKRGKTYGSFR